MDPYSVLGIKKNATQEEIKDAYRKKAMATHPDRNPGDAESAKLFKEVQAAYDILSDSNKKTVHNIFGEGSVHATWTFFGDAPPTNPHQRGRNIHLNLELELNEVLEKVKRKLNVPQRERCIKCEGAGYKEFIACSGCHGSGKKAMHVPGFNIYESCGDCRGSGRAGTIPCEDCKGEGFINKGEIEIEVQVPAGVETGNQIRISGYGEPSRNPFGHNGDLTITIVVKDHKIFARQNANLFLEFPLSYSELVLGATVEVPTLTSSTILNIPPRTLAFAQFRIKGMGVPYVGTNRNGDLLVTVKLAVPPKDKIKELTPLLEELQKLEKDYLTEARNKLKIN